MTSLAFMLGLLPLLFASGPGSAARRDIGTGVFFGMLVAITVGIVFVPFFFVAINKLTNRSSKNSLKIQMPTLKTLNNEKNNILHNSTYSHDRLLGSKKSHPRRL